jgi:anti-sigma factor RsiW
MAPSHPPFDRLTDLVRGDLSTDQQAEIAAHIVTCPLCADQVAWLEHILELYRTDESESAPPRAIRSVRDFLRSKVTPQGEES